MIETRIEVRGNKVCLYTQLESDSMVLEGQPVQFKVVAVGCKDGKIATQTAVEPILILGVEDARRLARQILSDTKEA